MKVYERVLRNLREQIQSPPVEHFQASLAFERNG
jgi:hypothetical protein